VIEFEESPDDQVDRKRPLSAEEAHRILRNIDDLSCVALGFDPPRSRPEWMIINLLPVAPPCVRPYVVLDSTLRSEDDMTYQYVQILKSNLKLTAEIEKGAANHII
jgi:DNA-directed RNA polymerase II subunit RPB1